MIRTAARLRAAHCAPIVGACFVGDGRLSFHQGLALCVARGATSVVIQPYVLEQTTTLAATIDGLIATGRAMFPQLAMAGGRPIGAHPAIADVIIQRAAEADYRHAHVVVDAMPSAAARMQREVYAERPHEQWRPLDQLCQAGLLIVFDGEVPSQARASAIKAAVARQRRVAAIHISALDAAPVALCELARQQIGSIIAVPYTLRSDAAFTQTTRAAVAAACADLPTLRHTVAAPLAYDRRVVAAIAAHVAEALRLVIIA